MSQYYAFWLTAFGISLGLMFEKVRVRNQSTRLLRSVKLMTREETDRLLSIWSACEDSTS
jgi:hypothetical protein